MVSGRDWVEAARVAVRLADREERDIPLIAIGRDLHGAADLAQRAGASLRIETRRPPAQLALWCHSRAHSSDFWRRSLPHSLSSAVERWRTTPPWAGTESLSGTLAESLEDLALASLGEAPGGALDAAVVLLQHLARHPLQRSNALGALVAALCQKPGTL